MTREELARYDGRDGRPAYVAVNGNVYDFSASKLWQSGDHQGQHQAGVDLTEALAKAPHVRAVIERFPVVGRLEAPAAAETKAGWSKVAILLGALFAAGVIALLLLLR